MPARRFGRLTEDEPLENEAPERERPDDDASAADGSLHAFSGTRVASWTSASVCCIIIGTLLIGSSSSEVEAPMRAAQMAQAAAAGPSPGGVGRAAAQAAPPPPSPWPSPLAPPSPTPPRPMSAPQSPPPPPGPSPPFAQLPRLDPLDVRLSSTRTAMWQAHAGLNCWRGHGAIDLEASEGEAFAVDGLDACKAACLAKAACEAVVFEPAQPRACYRRTAVDVAHCDTGSHFARAPQWLGRVFVVDPPVASQPRREEDSDIQNFMLLGEKEMHRDDVLAILAAAGTKGVRVRGADGEVRRLALPGPAGGRQHEQGVV